MLLNDKAFDNLPIGSVRSSGRIGIVTGLVINPNNLHIDAFKCRVARGHEQILAPLDIRELSNIGIVINDHDNLLDFDDAIRLKPILEINFNLLGLDAYIGKRKTGKVVGFALNTEDLYIHKIYVRPGIISRLNTDSLTFDRTNIVEVTDTKVVFNSSSKIRDRVNASVNKLPRISVAQPSASASFTSENE